MKGIILKNVLFFLIPFKVFSSVFLNGVRIDGVKNQVFHNCTVKIDSEGNIHIEAPGYRAIPLKDSEAKSRVSKSSSKLTKVYWLVTEGKDPSKTHYDIDVFINSVWVRRLRSSDPQVIMDISKYVKRGTNVVNFVAKKRKGGDFSADSYFRVVIGEGKERKGNVFIDNPLVIYRKSAKEREDSRDEFRFQGR